LQLWSDQPRGAAAAQCDRHGNDRCVHCRAQKGATAETEGEKPSLLELLLQNVLKNPYIWGMALTYFCIYVVRQGVTSWFVFYLMKVRSLSKLLTSPPLSQLEHYCDTCGCAHLAVPSVVSRPAKTPARAEHEALLFALISLLHLGRRQAKGVADAGSAAVRVSGMEVGGLFGSLLAGRLSDFLVDKYPNDGAVGKRVQVGARLGATVNVLSHTIYTDSLRQLSGGGTCMRASIGGAK